MKYITFTTLIALQMWCAAYDARIEQTLHIEAQPGCHYTQPITLVATAPFFAAPIPDGHPVPLTATETEALVDQADIASYLPALGE